MSHPNGGVARRATEIKRLQEKNPDSLVVDVGLWGPRHDADPNPDARGIAYMKCMSAMGYQAAGVAPDDFRFGKAQVLEAQKVTKFPLLACNLVDAATDQPLVDGSTVVAAGSLKVGIIGVSSSDDRSRLMPGGKRENDPLIQQELKSVKFLDAKESVRREIDGLPDDLSLIVVLSALPPEENVALAEAAPEIDLILTTQKIDDIVKPPGYDEMARPPALPRYRAVGSTYIMCGSETVGGQLLPQVRLTFAQGKISNATVNSTRLTSDIPDDKAVRALTWDYYQAMIQKMGLPSGEKRLAWASPEDNPRAKYLGAESCRRCHQAEYKQWSTFQPKQYTGHQAAWLHLIQRYYYFWPECVSCHTTGHGYESGFKLQEMSPDLRNVQCESCHGPGSLHADKPGTKNIRGKPTREVCDDCHAGPLPMQCKLPQGHIGDYHQDFQAYWNAILHKP